MSTKNWIINKKNNKNLEAKYPGVNRVVLQLLYNRGVCAEEEIKSFLNPSYSAIHDPFLFNDMKPLVDRIKSALHKNEKIFIYGDYDADGVCSSAIMSEVLRSVGMQKIEVYIPHRDKEGYGLNKNAIDYIDKAGGNLIITVDCGTGNADEVEYARKKGIDVIILDHHEEPEELPKGAVALLNPHVSSEEYPFAELSAAGVAFKAAQAICSFFELGEAKEKWLLDLVAIATVADMMKLIGENRILVKYGLIVLNKTQRPGLRAIISSMGRAGRELGVYEIGFLIGPRLNAAGRMDHASSAYELLESTNPSVIAGLAANLEQTNSSRQSETERILKQALEQVENQVDENKVLVAVGENWLPGVVGLVSSKLTEKFYRPSLVIARTDKGLVGSGRSIKGFNITSGLREASGFLSRFGGHEGACGFTLKPGVEVAEFQKFLNQYADQQISEQDLVKKQNIDMELGLDEISLDLAEQIESLAPFGVGNPAPRFVSFGARVESVWHVGGGKHAKLRLGQRGATREAIGFNFAEIAEHGLNEGDLIDIAYEINVNEWNNNSVAQLKIIDIKKE